MGAAGPANKGKEFITDNTQDCYSVSVIYEREIISERSQYLNIPLCSTWRMFEYIEQCANRRDYYYRQPLMMTNYLATSPFQFAIISLRRRYKSRRALRKKRL